MTPPRVLTECRELADAAEARRIEKIKSTAALVGSIAIATAWFIAAIIGSLLMVNTFDVNRTLFRRRKRPTLASLFLQHCCLKQSSESPRLR